MNVVENVRARDVIHYESVKKSLRAGLCAHQPHKMSTTESAAATKVSDELERSHDDAPLLVGVGVASAFVAESVAGGDAV